MPAITPLAEDELDPVLAAEIAARVAGGTLSSTLPVRIWARRPGAATAWVRLLAELQERSGLDERLRELVRLRIAVHTGCRTCQTGRKSARVDDSDAAAIAYLSPSDPRLSGPEGAALAYADLFAADWTGVDDAVYAELGRHFTVEQVVELQMLCALMLAGGRLAFVQRAWADDEQPAVLPGEGEPCGHS